MANRFYTFMWIPQGGGGRVRKWLISRKAVRWALGMVCFALVVGFTSSFLSLRYVARKGEFEGARLKNQYLEGKIAALQSKLRLNEGTLTRVQDFERKLRVLARLDTRAGSGGGMGPITKQDQDRMRGDETLREDGDLYAAVPREYQQRFRSLELSLGDFQRRAMLAEQSLQEVYEFLKDQETVLASTPSIRPADGWVTSHFGYRISPFTGLRQLHEGLDIAAPIGTKVIAAADGVVMAAGTDSEYGKVLSVNHGYGFVTRYAHNSEILVRVGQRVRRGEVIALVGSTGRSTGPHVHYEVRLNGIPVNPVRYILN